MNRKIHSASLRLLRRSEERHTVATMRQTRTMTWQCERGRWSSRTQPNRNRRASQKIKQHKRPILYVGGCQKQCSTQTTLNVEQPCSCGVKSLDQSAQRHDVRVQSDGRQPSVRPVFTQRRLTKRPKTEDELYEPLRRQEHRHTNKRKG